MMKKIITVLLTLTILLSLAACGGQAAPVETQGNDVIQTQQPLSSNDTTVPVNNPDDSVEVQTDSSFSVNLEGITTLDELEVRIGEQLDSAINSLASQWEVLSAEIDTYEKYCIEYSDWSNARSDAYGWWSDARSEVYGNWSDTRGDLYSFYSDIRSELYSGDTDEANAELQDFKDKVAKMG